MRYYVPFQNLANVSQCIVCFVFLFVFIFIQLNSRHFPPKMYFESKEKIWDSGFSKVNRFHSAKAQNYVRGIFLQKLRKGKTMHSVKMASHQSEEIIGVVFIYRWGGSCCLFFFFPSTAVCFFIFKKGSFHWYVFILSCCSYPLNMQPKPYRTNWGWNELVHCVCREHLRRKVCRSHFLMMRLSACTRWPVVVLKGEQMNIKRGHRPAAANPLLLPAQPACFFLFFFL